MTTQAAGDGSPIWVVAIFGEIENTMKAYLLEIEADTRDFAEAGGIIHWRRNHPGKNNYDVIIRGPYENAGREG